MSAAVFGSEFGEKTFSKAVKPPQQQKKHHGRGKGPA
jgi:hypothetical protein